MCRTVNQCRRKWPMVYILFISALLTSHVAFAYWSASVGDAWCFKTETISLCLPGTFELKRADPSGLEFVDNTREDFSQFISIDTESDIDEIIESYIGDTFEMESHNTYGTVKVWQFRPKEGGHFAHTIAVSIFYIENRVMVVINGKNASEFESLSSSILEQLIAGNQ